MFIQTEATPNPDSLKFIPGVPVLEQGTVMIESAEEAALRSPLAAALFETGDVKAVFLAHDFITVSKADHIGWDVVKPVVLTTLMEHFTAQLPVMLPNGQTLEEAREDVAEEDREVANQIKELIETRVRPAVAQDGGDIIFRGFRQGIVKLEMRGSCSGCPSSAVTLKNGVERMLKHYVPEIYAVEAV